MTSWLLREFDHSFSFLLHLRRSKLRVTVLGFACAVGYAPCLKEAGDQFNKWLANSTVRPTPDLRGTVYYYGMLANGNEQNWNAVWDLFLKETDASEKVKLMSALAAVQNPTLLKQYVNNAVKASRIELTLFLTLPQIRASGMGRETC